MNWCVCVCVSVCDNVQITWGRGGGEVGVYWSRFLPCQMCFGDNVRLPSLVPFLGVGSMGEVVQVLTFPGVCGSQCPIYFPGGVYE